MRILFCLFLAFGTMLCKANPEEHLASEKNVTISGQTNLNDQYSIYFISRNEGYKSYEISLSKEGSFRWESNINAPKFILVSIQLKAKTRQLGTNFSLYLKPGDNLKMKLNYTDSTLLSYVSGNMDDNNLALFNYSRFSLLEVIHLFKNPPTEGNLKTVLYFYMNIADSLIRKFELKNTTVKNYLSIWSYNDYQEALDRFSAETDFADLPKPFLEIYDNKTATLLPASARYINKYLDNLMGTTEERGLPLLKKKIALLNKTFSNPELKEWITARELEVAITRFSLNGNTDFDAQVALFTEIAGNVKDEEKRERLVNGFKNLRYTINGSSMPDVAFKDASGKLVSLKSFEGKPVYIDLWASWCIPCIAEVPNLKKLEEEYKDKNIVFISLSLDADKDAWMKKMKDLNLDGIQLELGDSDYDKMMNIQGIPHFVLYDASGKLKMYNAPRPGTDAIRKIFDSL